MTRNFKKRLLALVLTLALCTALMLSASAATKPTDSANAHTHVWASDGIPISITYAYENPTYHIATVRTHGYCTVAGCNANAILENTSRETHNNGYYCTLCHRYINMALPGEIMGVDCEYGC